MDGKSICQDLIMVNTRRIKKTSKLSFSDNLEVKYIINERDDSGYNY